MTTIEPKDLVDVVSNVSTILTAFVAVGFSVYLRLDALSKMRRLEHYLETESIRNPSRDIHTIYNIMSKTGLTKDEIVRAAFGSKHVDCRVHVTGGVADDLRFTYK